MIKLFAVFFILVFANAADKQFPKDFIFGAASSAYQVEGAWNISGKGESIWDRYTHTQANRILDGTTGDVACDSYYKIKEDVQILKNLGVHFYRFSLSWPRILPTGYINKINPDGIRYYNELINELLINDIKPVVTIYHWDLPQSLQEAGGWPNPLIADYYADFARLAFRHFGDRVKTWITINEPYHICQSGFETGIMAPGFMTKGYANYMCAYTVLLAHAKAYHIYNDEFRKIQNGKIGITIDTFWYEPKSDKPEDVYAADLTLQLNYVLYVHPIFSKTGDFPPLVKEHVLKRSMEQNLRRSRLPEFTKEQIDYIKGSADFLGLNHYSTFLVGANSSTAIENLVLSSDIDFQLEQDPEWEDTPTFWIKIVPWGLRKLLNWIKDEFDNPKVFITENGMGDTEMVLNDETRVRYFQGYIEAVLDAILEDGCNIMAYTAWSLMDNFEWNSGYQLRFGIHAVDFDDPDRKRMPKSSALYYKKVVQTRRVDHKYEEVSTKRTEL